MGWKALLGVSLCLLGGTWLVMGKPPKGQEMKPTVKTTLGETTDIHALAFSPDGKRLLAGGEKPGREQQDQNPEVVEWDIQTKAACQRYDSGHYGQISMVNYSSSGRLIAIGYLDGFVSVRDRKGRTLQSFMSIENDSSVLKLSVLDSTESAVYSIVHRNIAQRRSITTGQTSIYYVPCEGFSITSTKRFFGF